MKMVLANRVKAMPWNVRQFVVLLNDVAFNAMVHGDIARGVFPAIFAVFSSPNFATHFFPPLLEFPPLCFWQLLAMPAAGRKRNARNGSEKSPSLLFFSLFSLLSFYLRLSCHHLTKPKNSEKTKTSRSGVMMMLSSASGRW